MVEEVVQLTCVTDNTYLEDRDSYLNMNPGDKNMPAQQEYCYRTSAIRIQEVRCWMVRSEKASLVRSTMTQWCKTSANCRSEWMKIQETQENQPGVTKYRRSMPVAAVAKAEKAAYHSHTAVVEGRDDCNTVRLLGPGFALGRSTGDPAFRFEGSSPGRTVDQQTQ